MSKQHASLQRHQGNTLTGLIIGLIIGLGIAVAVALVITKGSTPFTDKSGKLGKMADPTPGQAADPNKPLYSSKDAAKEANRQLTEKKAADADPLAQVIAGLKDPADQKAEGKAPAPAVVPTPSDVAKPLPAAAPAPAAAAPATDNVVYYLQIGAFREMAEAESARGKLALLGFEAAVSDRSTDAGVLHRVRIGPYNQVEAVNKARSKLLDAGIGADIVRNQK